MKKLNIFVILGLFFAGSIGGQLGIEATKAAFWQWSTTSINNQTADPSINWSEGQSPSTVNDSARAMMARLAEQAKDTSGQLTTAGGPVAFTVTTNQGFPNPPQDGMVIGLSFNVTNGNNPTLAVDGGTANAIVVQLNFYAPPGTLVPGAPYTMKFNAASSQWMLRDIGGGLANVPIGTILPYTIAGNPADTNYIVAAGECISQTTYATYYALLGSPGAGACPAGQFAVIDLRGRVLAGTDVMGGSGSAGRLTTSTQGCGAATTAIGSTCATLESHTMALAEIAVHNHGAPMYDPTHWHQLPYADPGHYHPTATADPTHVHPAGIYDPGNHVHSYNQPAFSFLGQCSSCASVYAPSGTNTGGSGTGVLVNGGPYGNNNTYNAGTGVYMSSGNGANTTGSQGTGITFTGTGGNWSDYAKATGVRVNGVALDFTANAGSTTPFSVVQPTIVVNYIIRVL